MRFKKVLNGIVAAFLCAILMVFCVGCNQESDDEVTFDKLSVVLLNFDDAVRPFLSTLQYDNFDSDDYDLLSSAASSITTLTYEMGESFKSFGVVVSEVEKTQAQGTVVVRTNEKIEITTESMQFTAKLNSNCMSIFCKSSAQEYLFEIVLEESGRYFAQVITKNVELDNYSIYQLSFLDTKGQLGVDLSATGYVPIYGAEITAEEFPILTYKSFKNI